MPESHLPNSMVDDNVKSTADKANHCFVCGVANPRGLHLEFTFDASDPKAPQAFAAVQLDRTYEGPPGCIHGGIIAALLDEAMGKLNLPLGILAMTRHIEVDYLRPAPLYQSLRLMSTHVRSEGRKFFHVAELRHEDGTVLAKSKGLFLMIDPHYLSGRR